MAEKFKPIPIHEARVYGTGSDYLNGRWYAFVPDLGAGALPLTYRSRYDLDQDVRRLLRELDDDPWGGFVIYTPALAAEVVAAGIEL